MNKAFESAERVHINENRWRWWWRHRTSCLLLLVYCIKSRYFLVLVQEEEEEEERFCRLPPPKQNYPTFFSSSHAGNSSHASYYGRLSLPCFALVPSPSPFSTLFFSFFFLPSFSCYPLSSPDLYNYAHLHLPSKYEDFLILSNAPLWLPSLRINNKSPSMGGLILLFTLFTSLYATDGPAR